MAVPNPSLDDRTFADLFADARRLIQERCPEWTDTSPADPGTVLIEAFARLVDQAVYRVNRIPEKVHLDFLDMLDVSLSPARAARTEATFWLAAPQGHSVRVPAGTEITTARVPHDDVQVFTVDRGVDIAETSFAEIGSVRANGPAVLSTQRFEAGEPVTCFSQIPAPGDAFLIGLTNPAPRCAVALRLDCVLEGVGVDPRRPPVVWEAWCGNRWEACEVAHDETGGFNKPGEVLLHIPDGHTRSVIDRRSAAWLRCRIVTHEDGRPAYAVAPHIMSAEAFTIGGTTTAGHFETVRDEELGFADGTPGQTLRLARAPVVARSLTGVRTEGVGPVEMWTPVASFAESSADDRHVRVDEATGEVHFGPRIRARDGEMRQYGAVPERGARVVAVTYGTGGGLRGNVAAGALSVLRTSIPFIAGVTNRAAATGGLDIESLDAAKQRAAQWLRTQRRAVTARDYEVIARSAYPSAARIHCVEDLDVSDHGPVRVIVVPAVTPQAVAEDWRVAVPADSDLEAVAKAIDLRRILGTRVIVSGPDYQGVTVVARVTAAAGSESRQVHLAVLDALNALVASGAGTDHSGRALGRRLSLGEVYAAVSAVPGVETTEQVEMYAADLETGARGAARDRISPGPHGLFLPYRHQVFVTSADQAELRRQGGSP